MSTVRAAVLTSTAPRGPWADSRPLRVQELELDPPGPGEVLVRLEAAGVCHSDLSRVTGARACPLPCVLGHEGAGTVLEVGSDVTAAAVGDRVVTVFQPRCGTCATCTSPRWGPCPRGSAATAEGTMVRGGRRWRVPGGGEVSHQNGVSAFATRAVVDQGSLVVVPRELRVDVAALLGCAVLTGGGAVRNAGRLEAGESVAVVGLGGVGLAALLVARASGAGDVTAVDTLPAKHATATGMGADRARTPEDALADTPRHDLVVECVGHPAALETALRLTRPGGRTVTIGLPPPDTRLPLPVLDLVLGARSLIGSYAGSGDARADVLRYAAMQQAGELGVERLVTGHVPLAEVNRAMDDLHAGRAVRQVLDLAAEPG